MESDQQTWQFDTPPGITYQGQLMWESFDRDGFFSFCSRKKEPMIKTMQPLPDYCYYTWSFLVKELPDWSELMIGVATEKADFRIKWNDKCRIGNDEHSWAISSRGRICHNGIAVAHEKYKIYNSYKISVHMDLINRSLMFSINGNMIGLRYENIPLGLDIYPVIGVVGQADVFMYHSNMERPSLQLLSLISYNIFYCQTRAPQHKQISCKMPKGSSYLWHDLVLRDWSHLPYRMQKWCDVVFPTCPEDYHLTQLNLQLKHHSKTKTKYYNLRLQRLPKAYKLPDPFKIVEKPPRRLLERKVVIPKSRGVDAARFVRRRNPYYISSSDDEIFPHLTKTRRARRKKTKAF